MGYRIGKKYAKMECPLCHSVYLLDFSEIYQRKVNQVDPDPNDPDDDGTRYNYEFYCEDCNRTMKKGIYMGSFVATDAFIESCIEEMKPLR